MPFSCSRAVRECRQVSRTSEAGHLDAASFYVPNANATRGASLRFNPCIPDHLRPSDELDAHKITELIRRARECLEAKGGHSRLAIGGIDNFAQLGVEPCDDCRWGIRGRKHAGPRTQSQPGDP